MSVEVSKVVLTELISVWELIRFRALWRLMFSSPKLGCRVLCSGARLFLVLKLGVLKLLCMFSRLHVG